MKREATIIEAQKVLNQVKSGKVAVTRAIQFVAGKYKSIGRADLLAMAEKAGINAHTANTQFYRVRSGKVKAPRSLN